MAGHDEQLARSYTHRAVSAKSVLMLFAPKFNDFGCDVARAFTARCNGGRVHGLFTGPREVREHVAGELGDIGGQFWWFEEEEEAWLSTPASTDELRRLQQDLGPGAFGRIVTADRRAGREFVRGGLLRPDRIGRRIARDPAPTAQRYVHGLYRVGLGLGPTSLRLSSARKLSIRVRPADRPISPAGRACSPGLPRIS